LVLDDEETGWRRDGEWLKPENIEATIDPKTEVKQTGLLTRPTWQGL
jgi:hypothetical protein